MKKIIPLLLVVTLLSSLFACYLRGFELENDNQENNENQDSIIGDNTEPDKNVLPQKDFSEMVVNCLGDSLTYGANPNGSQMQYPYPELLKQELNFKTVNNFGVGGTKIANEGESSFLDRYEDMPDADIVLVMGGTNDALSFSHDMIYRTPLGQIDDFQDTTFYGALNSLCYKLQNKYKDSLIIFITPLPIADAITNWTTASGSFSVEQAGIAIKQVCEKFGIYVFDAYNLTGYGDISNSEYSTGSGDGIHPSQDFWRTDFTPKLVNYIKSLVVVD